MIGVHRQNLMSPPSSPNDVLLSLIQIRPKLRFTTPRILTLRIKIHSNLIKLSIKRRNTRLQMPNRRFLKRPLST